MRTLSGAGCRAPVAGAASAIGLLHVLGVAMLVERVGTRGLISTTTATDPAGEKTITAGLARVGRAGPAIAGMWISTVGSSTAISTLGVATYGIAEGVHAEGVHHGTSVVFASKRDHGNMNIRTALSADGAASLAGTLLELSLACVALSTGLDCGLGRGACWGVGSVSPPVSIASGGNGTPELSQSQSQNQFQVQSRPVPPPPTVVNSVVVPHQSKLHVQSQEGSAAGSDCGASVWTTGPSSPGLRMRTDTFTLVFAGLACGRPDPRSSLVPWGLDPASDSVCGVTSGSSSHDQFQTQFHTQSRDSGSPLSVDVDVG